MNHCLGATIGKGYEVCGLGQMPLYSEIAGAKLYAYPDSVYG